MWGAKGVHELLKVHATSLHRQPTEDEYDQHCVTHIPPPRLVQILHRQRGRVDRHPRLHSEDRLMPILSFDPFFPELREDGRPPTAMTFFDSGMKRLGMTMLPTNAIEHPRASKWLVAHTELSGHEEATVKSDDEPAAPEMKKQAMELTQVMRLAPEENPSRDLKSNTDAGCEQHCRGLDAVLQCADGRGHQTPGPIIPPLDRVACGVRRVL